jgi:hypothetical protein
MTAIEAGRKGGPRPVNDESKLFSEQAFADITVAADKGILWSCGAEGQAGAYRRLR